MKFSIRHADKIVGTLVVLGLAMLVFVIFMLGSSQRWFKSDTQYRTYFTSASGISVNMPIQFRGFSIGNVKRIRLAEDDRVEVVFSIFEEYAQRVKVGSLVEFLESPIGLGSTFIFHPGFIDELIPADGVIPEINSIEAKALIASGLAVRPESGADNINAILNEVRILLESINVASEENEEEPALSQIVKNLELATNDLADIMSDVEIIASDASSSLGAIMRDFEAITGKLAAPDGIVMTVLDSEGAVYTSLEESIVSIASIIDSLDRTAQFLPAQLPQIGVLISQLNVTLITVQDVLVALANNPLLRGGIPVRTETGPGGANPRNLEF
ncbi:MAG: MlaD family protein [Treponema sp.]|jgi:phospholipid/cholesterol/gamma-HCH transport system substrate-binding protein|nr:MlaD family protein [Treponema sp.]